MLDDEVGLTEDGAKGPSPDLLIIGYRNRCRRVWAMYEQVAPLAAAANHGEAGLGQRRTDFAPG